MGWIRSVIAIAIIAQLSGCSLLFVKKAPSNVPQGAWVDCTESKVWPVVDAVVGVSFLLGGLGVTTVADDTNTESEEDVARVIGPIYALMGIGMLYSSYVGFKETNRCGRIHDQAYPPQPYYPYPAQPYPYPPPQPYPQPQPQPQPAPEPQPAPAPPSTTPPSL